MVAVVLSVPGVQTVTVVRRVRQRDGDAWARDARGNAVYTEEQVPVPACSVQPASGSETDAEGRVQVTQRLTVYAPLSFPAGPVDAVEIDGIRYEVDGLPQRWAHPRLGHVILTVQEANG